MSHAPEKFADASLSFAQEQLWFMDRLGAGAVYNVPLRVRLRGRLDAQALHRALQDLVRRHEVLRSVYPEQGGRPTVRVHAALELALSRIDLSSVAAAERDASAQRLSVDDALAPFDVARGPLVRASLLKLGDAEHLLLLTMHHIVTDGWSTAVVLQDLSALYAAHVEGRPAALPELPIQYLDFAAWQREWLSGDLLGELVGYWRERLAGAPEHLDLPTDRALPPHRQRRGGRHLIDLAPQLGQRLRALATRHRTTLRTVCMAAFQVLLQRHGGQDDLLIGTPVANRPHSELEGLIGNFVDVLVVRGDLSGDPTFEAYLARTAAAMTRDLDHKDLPLGALVATLWPNRDPLAAALIQAMFDHIEDPSGAMQIGGIEADLIDTMNHFAGLTNADFALTLVERRGELRCMWEYAADLFDADTMKRVAESYLVLLEAIAERPDLRLSRLPVIPDAERRRLLEGGRAPHPTPAPLVPPTFAATAARRPDAIAVEHRGARIAYGELDARTDQLAHRLVAMGVGPETRVACLLPPSIDAIVAFLAILKAGGAYLPLDPTYPKTWVELVVADARPAVVIGSVETLAAQQLSIPSVSLDGERASLAALPAHSVGRTPRGDALAYVIYTSGSSGTPKGVQVSHQNLAHHCRAIIEDHYFLRSDDRVLQFNTLSFDPSIEEIMPTLLVGACLVIPAERIASAVEFRRTLRDQAITVAMPPPSYLQEALDAWSDGEAAGEAAIDSVRLVATGGEVVRPELIPLCARRLPRATVINVYGPTEATISSVNHVIPPGAVPRPDLQIPIGRAHRGRSAYVLDRNLELAPIGAMGELYLGGAGVSRGYMNRPELTAVRFVPDPFAREPGATMYRTGDLVRYRADGELEFHGRVDGMIKLRGFRIELGEIEATLSSHPGVAKAVVLVRKGKGKENEELVAYAIPKAAADAPAPETLRACVQAKLPPYMVPSAVVLVESFPRLPNGKVDQAALALLAPAPSASHAPAGRPLTPTEELIAASWRALLGADAIGPDDDFFALGGHSLLAVRLISRVREMFEIELPLTTVFAAPTLADFARAVDAARHPALAGPVRRPREPGADLPMSFAQERLWVLQQLEPASAAYHICGGVRLRGPLDAAVLEHSFGALVRRHASLRTTFHDSHGDPVQRIADTMAFSLARLDRRGAPAADVDALIQADARRPFDLGSGPLLRALLVQTGDDTHVLGIAMHHIISDGWSLEVLVRELAAAYQAGLDGQPVRYPDLAIEYADYGLWQRERLDGGDLDDQLQFWTRALAEPRAVLELPSFRRRSKDASADAGIHEAAIGPAIHRAVTELCQREGVTLFMAMLAAFDALLHRYTGQTDILVGTPIANRARKETEGLIGFFANTLVMRTEVSPAQSFRDVLRRVRAGALAAYHNEDVPFERVVQTLQPERDLGQNPLFQMMLVVQNAPLPIALAGLTLEPFQVNNGTSKFDLSLFVDERPDGLHLLIEYRRDLLDAQLVQQLARHFASLLEAVAADPTLAVGRIPLLSDAETRTLLAAWNDTARALPLHRTFIDRFEDQARTSGERRAASDRTGEVSYAELDRRASRVAHALRRTGVGPESRVGLLTERHIGLLTVILGVFKADGAYVPLDPAYPIQRLRQILDDAGCATLVVDRALAPRLAEALALTERAGAPTVLVLESLLEDRALPDTPPRRAATPHNLAYVIFTSGSTGKPKGAMVEQVGMLNHLCAKVDQLAIAPGDTILQNTSQCFDISVWQFLAGLLVGAGVRIVDADTAADPRALLAVLETERVTLAEVVPTYLRAMLDEVERPWQSALRWFAVAGEALPPDLCRTWFARHPAIPLLNHYGPTECSDGVTHGVIAAPPDASVMQMPIGVPVGNMRMYVVDRSGELVPPGCSGELLIGGIGVGRGYIGDPVKTAQSFAPDPFSPLPGARLYRTGDLVRHRPDGVLEFLGRLDHQVKIRGFRIELGEIEATLRSHAAVHDAVVVSQSHAGQQRLVAYVATRDADDSALRAHLKASLPEYMVPAAILCLAELPLTPNGKVNRKALPAVDGGALSEALLFAAPRTALEQTIAEVWQNVLELPRIGIDNDFFELGGHSLVATRVAARLRAALDLDLPLRKLFEHPTVRGLARAVEEAQRSRTARPNAPALQALPRGGAPLVLSHGQERLWFLEQLEPGTARYNVPSAVVVDGPCDPGAMKRALAGVVARHETLRTTFPVADGRPVQRIHPALDPALDVPVVEWDLRAEPDATARDRRCQLLLADEAARPFDLAEGPLVRAALVRLEPARTVLALTVHHIVADGWSLGVLVRELGALYAAELGSPSAPLAPLAFQFADYAAWHRRWLEQDVLDPQLAHWRKVLEGPLGVVQFPGARRSASRTPRGRTMSVPLSRDLQRALHALCQREGVTLFMALLAGFDALLHRYTGQSDILVGTPIANRQHPETEALIGFFVNTLVLRNRVRDTATFRELLSAVRETALDAYAHQDVPFERLVEELQPHRDLDQNPIFQVMFGLQNAPMPLAWPGLKITPISVDSGAAKFDLMFLVEERPDELVLHIESSEDALDAEMLAPLARHYVALLDAVAADPTLAIGRIPLLSDAETQTLLTGWNDTGRELPLHRTFIDLFETQARIASQRRAAKDRTGEVSYAELDRRASRLAHALRNHGIGPDARVGLLTERHIGLLTVILGVFKADGAYVPLDPAYPVPRLRQILDEAGCAALVVDRALAPRLEEALAHRGRAGQPAVLVLESLLDDRSLPDTPPRRTATPRNLAYVIFTSGSTGKPKGVMVEQVGMLNHLYAKVEQLAITPRDTILQNASQCFDISVWQFLVGLLVGGDVRIVDADTAAEPQALLGVLETERVTIAEVVPTFLRAMLDEIERPWRLPLRWLVVTGEALPPDLCRTWFARHPAIPLLNAYGPTECSDDVTHAVVAAPPDASAMQMPIGLPVANMRMYVVGPSDELVPPGCTGELLIGGIGVGRGYLDDPVKTALAFVPDPFSATPGARLYRSGDLVRHLPGGALEFLGRLDHQVKVRGFRIELGDVEETLRGHAAVHDAVVVCQAHAGENRLVAYAATGDGGATDASALRAHLQALLPDYMVPAAIICLARLPLTPNGKIDRNALPAVDADALAEARPFTAPRTPLEQSIALIWQEVLEIPRIGIDDNFFEIGGHSLLATRVASRLRAALALDLPLRKLFEFPTVRGLARELLELQIASANPEDLDQVLALVEGMTDEEVAAALAQLGHKKVGT